MKTLWFAARYYYRQEKIPQVSPMPIKHHHQFQLDLVFSVTEAYNTNSGLLMFDNLMLIQKVKGFSSKKMKGFFMSGAGLRFTWP